MIHRPSTSRQHHDVHTRLDDHQRCLESIADQVDAIASHLGMVKSTFSKFSPDLVKQEQRPNESADDVRKRLARELSNLNNRHALDPASLSEDEWDRRRLLIG